MKYDWFTGGSLDDEIFLLTLMLCSMSFYKWINQNAKKAAVLSQKRGKIRNLLIILMKWRIIVGIGRDGRWIDVFLYG